MLGVGSAQLISISVMPILTHLYKPIFIGLLGVFSSFIIIFRMISNGGYEAAIVLPQSDKAAAQLLYLCFFFNILTAFLAAILAFGGDQLINYLYPKEKLLQQVIWLLPISVFFEAGGQSLRYWHTRFKYYKIISAAKISQAITVAVVSIILAFQGIFLEGLIIGYVLGQAVGWGVLLFVRNPFFYRYSIDLQTIIVLMKQYGQFFKYGVMGSWLNSLSSQLPFFILPTLPMGAVVVGFYTVAYRIMNAPLNLVSSSISSVFYEKATKVNQEGKSLAKLTKETGAYLLLMAIIPTILIMLLAPPVFALIFGAEYYDAGIYARYLAPWFLVKFISHPLSFLVDVKIKLLPQLIFNIIMFVFLYGVLSGFIEVSENDIILNYGLVGWFIATVYLVYLLYLGDVFSKKLPDK